MSVSSLLATRPGGKVPQIRLYYELMDCRSVERETPGSESLTGMLDRKVRFHQGSRV